MSKKDSKKKKASFLALRKGHPKHEEQKAAGGVDVEAGFSQPTDEVRPPLTRYVEDEFGEGIVQETEIIEAVDSGLIPRPDPQDVDSSTEPESNAKDTQLLFKPSNAAGLWVQAVIVDGICTATHWHAPFAELEGFSAAPDFAGATLDELHKAGFRTAVESGLQTYVNENRAY